MRDFFLTFVTHPGCNLCHEAEPLVQRVAQQLGVVVEVVDMGSDDELVSRYALRVPVVLGPQGQVLAEGVIQRRPLRRAVRRARRGR